MKADVARTVRAARTPHGYTLAVWSAGSLCIHAHGQPDLGAVLLFIAGATCIFGLITWWVRSSVITPPPDLPWAAVHLVAVVAAASAAWLAARVLSAPWCWLACSSASSGIFLLAHSAQDLMLRRMTEGGRRSRETAIRQPCYSPGDGSVRRT